jgi:hypothetical protein
MVAHVLCKHEAGVRSSHGPPKEYMKSPVYGARAGNVKCRGKKTKLMSCGCCMMIDFRWDYRFKQAAKETL